MGKTIPHASTVKKVNTYAKDLAEPKYRQRIVLDKKKYKRKKQRCDDIKNEN